MFSKLLYAINIEVMCIAAFESDKCYYLYTSLCFILLSSFAAAHTLPLTVSVLASFESKLKIVVYIFNYMTVCVCVYLYTHLNIYVYYLHSEIPHKNLTTTATSIPGSDGRNGALICAIKCPRLSTPQTDDTLCILDNVY